MSLRDQLWWPELVEALETTPLVEVAAIYKVDVPRIVASLVEDSHGGSALEEPWWPEAIRVVHLHGVRQAARTFGAKPRRIRRGLARAGVRVAGRNLNGGNHPALDAVRDRLGQVADHVLATEAGVCTEAVQGERRRLGVAAFRPARRVVEPQGDAPVVDEPPVAASALEPADPLEDEVAVRAPRRRLVRAPVQDAPDRPERRQDSRVRTWARSADGGEGEEPPVTQPIPPAAPTPAPIVETRTLRRRGRTRLIRRDTIEIVEPVPEEPVLRRLRRRRKVDPLHGQVRDVKVTDVDLAELIESTNNAPRSLVTPTPVEDESAELAAVEPAAVEPAAVEPAAVEPAAVEPAAVEPAAVEPAAVEPAAVEPAAVEPAAVEAPDPVVVRSPCGWTVVVDGQTLPVLIMASDIAAAAELAKAHVDPARLAGASIYKIGPSLDALPG